MEIFCKMKCNLISILAPDHLSLDRAPNLGPLISCWEINKFKNLSYKRVWILEVLKLLFQQFLNSSSSQWDTSGPILEALSNNRWLEVLVFVIFIFLPPLVRCRKRRRMRELRSFFSRKIKKIFQNILKSDTIFARLTLRDPPQALDAAAGRVVASGERRRAAEGGHLVPDDAVAAARGLGSGLVRRRGDPRGSSSCGVTATSAAARRFPQHERSHLLDCFLGRHVHALLRGTGTIKTKLVKNVH